MSREFKNVSKERNKSVNKGQTTKGGKTPISNPTNTSAATKPRKKQ